MCGSDAIAAPTSLSTGAAICGSHTWRDDTDGGVDRAPLQGLRLDTGDHMVKKLRTRLFTEIGAALCPSNKEELRNLLFPVYSQGEVRSHVCQPFHSLCWTQRAWHKAGLDAGLIIDKGWEKQFNNRRRAHKCWGEVSLQQEWAAEAVGGKDSKKHNKGRGHTLGQQ